MNTNEQAKSYIQSNKAIRQRVGLIQPFFISQIDPKASSILDVGCGDGHYHKQFLQKCKNLTNLVGIDSSQPMISNIKQNHNAIYKCLNATDQNQQFRNKFDLITAVFMIEFLQIEELNKFLDNCCQWLMQNGQLIIISIDTNVLIKSKAYGNSITYKVIDQGPFKEGGQFRVKIGSWQHTNHHYSPLLLTQLLQKRQLKVEVNYVNKNIIDKNLFSQEQIKEIEQVNCVYALKAKKIV